MPDIIEVYTESGKRRSVAAVVAWPGWCRSARDEQAALEALVAYAPRYARLLDGTGLTAPLPTSVADLQVAERLPGSATTDFGAPDRSPSADEEPFDDVARARAVTLLRAFWQGFDAAVGAAEGKALRKGPRGGGRELEAIRRHVVESEQSYLSAFAGPTPLPKNPPPQAVRAAIEEALERGMRGELPAEGPRGGKRWSPRYAVRRIAWHLLDHLWEIEDRAG